MNDEYWRGVLRDVKIVCDAALERAEKLQNALDWSMNVNTIDTPFGPYRLGGGTPTHHCGTCQAPPTIVAYAFTHQADCEWKKAADLLATTPEPAETGVKP